MCAKLGEFVRIIKAKSLIAKDFFRGEAFSQFAVKRISSWDRLLNFCYTPVVSLTCTFSTLFNTSTLLPWASRRDIQQL